MKAKITVAIEDYRPNYPTGQNIFLLQSPISPERRPGDEILVRQDRGEFKNKVTFRKPDELVKLDSAPKTAYADGILLRSDPSERHLEGDQLWLDESVPKRPGSGITAVNLRTWEYITVALGDVCWIPKYRKLDCGEDYQELLTISGPTVKRPKKGYVLAVVQRLRSRGGNFEVEGVELREIVEQDLWKYQNLTTLPDGEKRIEELFRRSLASVRPATSFDLDTDDETATQPSVAGPGTATGSSRAVSLTPSQSDITEEASLSISIDYSLPEDEDDPIVEQRCLELERKVMAKLARKPEPIIRGPPPVICNLGHRCPTPPRIFFQANVPTLENLYPKHHHLADHKCPIGARHKLHCVFQFRRDGNDREFIDKTSCTVPPSVRHTCCRTNARPLNKPFSRPPATIVEVGAGGVVVSSREGRGGRGRGGDFSVVGELESDYSDLPVEVEEMPFDPARDLDEVGRMAFGYTERVAMADLAAECVNSFSSPWDALAGLEPLGSSSRPIVLEDDNDNDEEDEDEEEEEGGEEEEEEPDVFGDRHFHDGDEMDLDE
ncbi:hypothetical protein VMCG_02090 [Cytospora schulzeri]|uniref:Uncharacterized protein n=1 Tax=Cytospora schulzeri TaxID=448051 RepID=A0A423X371_9PEZI|nr:hypothetical protein VMCG_02090 [Valsa malicola]